MSDCDTLPAEQVYLGHDNVVSIIPYSDVSARTNFDMTAVTLVEASADLVSSTTTGDDITASSADSPVTIWWNLVTTTTGEQEWQIHMKVGLFVGITAGSYKLRVIITDPDNLNGLVICDDLLVDVVDVP